MINVVIMLFDFTLGQSLYSVVVITSALHAEGPRFEPWCKQVF